MNKYVVGFLIGSMAGVSVTAYFMGVPKTPRGKEATRADFRYAAYFFRSDGLPKIRMFEDGTFVLHDSLGNKSVIIKNKTTK